MEHVERRSAASCKLSLSSGARDLERIQSAVEDKEKHADMLVITKEARFFFFAQHFFRRITLRTSL